MLSIARTIAMIGIGTRKNIVAPGTVASFNALFIFLITRLVTGNTGASWWYLMAVYAVVAFWATTVMLRESGERDPSWIVVDEWVAVWFMCAALVTAPWYMLVVAVGLFRLFDIYKPGIISWAERLPGAWGVLADDYVAAAHVIFLFKIVPIWQWVSSVILR